jgi:uncharacterized protein (UPF0548 family)
MFTLKKPDEATLNRYLDNCQKLSYSYRDVGATDRKQEAVKAPTGFKLDTYEIDLGSGEETYQRAKKAIREWKMFPRSMVSLFWPTAPIEKGAIVALLFRYGFWALNSARIVYTFDETGASDRFGFAYGTLTDHVESGEEQFAVSWDHETDRVSYQINVFSRPAHWLVWLGYPFARREQARFRKLSGQAMQESVQLETTTTSSTR